ncbi:AbrB family transcriptional regulator [Tsukamurella sp. 8F]|uniref:AbrB family transcriptional regulator n=1 Tax=unclassified Tsukamurella TaxID=2633480 RepID=UPI0023BA33A9|nr:MULTISPECIES: AbrB family transcriptional regulator [unclassified Tsukamurella]MDF0531635.1 AbrB family transcriptional regulator [Tsukamurella sp. 8J]MDF0588797.1 AbrB family transcriptional regulator [Tsukamurella sp. 8F]
MLTRRWLPLVAVSVVAGLALDVIGVPSGMLFAALACAAGFALAGRAPDRLPRPALFAAQGVLGTTIGTMVQSHTLAALGPRWPAVLGVGFGTLALSVAAGALLGRHRATDPLTGSLALVAGGASGLVAIARELGGDERTVAVVQYLRVGLVTLTLPLIAALYPHVAGGSTIVSAGRQPWWLDVLFTVGCTVVGVAVGRLLHLPAGALLGPMVLASAFELTGIVPGAAVPGTLVALGYLAIGWQAGLGFTRDSIRHLARLLPWAVALIVAIGAGCAGLGALLSLATGTSALDGYLATTPGGVYAVLAVASSSGVDITFVVAAQMTRVVLMLALAPWAARMFQRIRHRRADGRAAPVGL